MRLVLTGLIFAAGLLFLFMVMYAPGGIASLIMMNLRVAAFGRLRSLLGPYLMLFGAGAVALAGASAMIEMEIIPATIGTSSTTTDNTISTDATSVAFFAAHTGVQYMHTIHTT